MTRKDFELIAKAFRDARADMRNKEPDESQADLQDGASYVAEELAAALAATNPRFDRERFLKACGVAE